jgi:hypothetical protein
VICTHVMCTPSIAMHDMGQPEVHTPSHQKFTKR